MPKWARERGRVFGPGGYICVPDVIERAPVLDEQPGFEMRLSLERTLLVGGPRPFTEETAHTFERYESALAQVNTFIDQVRRQNAEMGKVRIFMPIGVGDE